MTQAIKDRYLRGVIIVLLFLGFIGYFAYYRLEVYEMNRYTQVTDEYFSNILHEYFSVYLHEKLLYIRSMRLSGELKLHSIYNLDNILTKYTDHDSQMFTSFTFNNNGNILDTPKSYYSCLSSDTVLCIPLQEFIKRRQVSFATTWIIFKTNSGCNIPYLAAVRYNKDNKVYYGQAIELSVLQKREQLLLDTYAYNIIRVLRHFNLYVTITNRAWDNIYSGNPNVRPSTIGPVIQKYNEPKFHNRVSVTVGRYKGSFWYYAPLKWYIVVWHSMNNYEK